MLGTRALRQDREQTALVRPEILHCTLHLDMPRCKSPSPTPSTLVNLHQPLPPLLFPHSVLYCLVISSDILQLAACELLANVLLSCLLSSSF